MSQPTSTGVVSNLPQLRRLVTSHNSSGQAIVQSAGDFKWQSLADGEMAFSVVYTTSSFPPDLNDEADIKTHDSLMEKGIGLVNSGGTVLRCVDFKPGIACAMHRTQSIDYGIVLEGNIDMVLDSGEVQSLKKGDVAVQRATQHQWINTSKTEWARMMFVLSDCKPLEVNGERLREDLGTVAGVIPPSGNDA